MMDVKASNENLLNAGDPVQAIKNIHLTSDAEEIECNVDKVKGLVLKTCFLKKSEP